MNIAKIVAKLFGAMFFVFSTLQFSEAEAKEAHGKNTTICDDATTIAAEEYEIPLTILQAVARTESGITIAQKHVPWPWSINIEGRGVRLNSLKETASYFRKNYASGSRNIDVGCFQINHRWHGQEFSSLEEMLDPYFNARYAARFLKGLHWEFGDWVAAVGAYHSRNEETSEIYLAKYMPILRKLQGISKPVGVSTARVPNRNAFPLLKGNSQSHSSGSLFPSDSASRGSLLSYNGANG